MVEVNVSSDIRKYKSMDLLDSSKHDMTLTAFVGGKRGRSIQFTIWDSFNLISDIRIAGYFVR